MCGYPISGCSGVVVEYRTRNREVAGSTHTRSLQATLSKLLTYCVLRPTQPPTLSGTGNLRLRGEGLVWLIGAMVCLLAAPWVNCPLARAMDGHIMRCGIIGSCQYFRYCKALLVTSLTRVGGAITSVQTFTFTFTRW